jgi:uncharacterized membrane protein
MKLKVAQFFTLFLFALVAGVFWGTWFSLARSIDRLAPATFLEVGLTMIRNLAVPMATLSPAAILVSIAMLFLISEKKSAAFAFALTGALLMIAAIAITLVVNVPIDNQIKTWTLTSLPPDWTHIRDRWEVFHTARTFLSLGALASVLVSILRR